MVMEPACCCENTLRPVPISCVSAACSVVTCGWPHCEEAVASQSLLLFDSGCLYSAIVVADRPEVRKWREMCDVWKWSQYIVACGSTQPVRMCDWPLGQTWLLSEAIEASHLKMWSRVRGDAEQCVYLLRRPDAMWYFVCEEAGLASYCQPCGQYLQTTSPPSRYFTFHVSFLIAVPFLLLPFVCYCVCCPSFIGIAPLPFYGDTDTVVRLLFVSVLIRLCVFSFTGSHVIYHSCLFHCYICSSLHSCIVCWPDDVAHLFTFTLLSLRTHSFSTSLFYYIPCYVLLHSFVVLFIVVIYSLLFVISMLLLSSGESHCWWFWYIWYLYFLHLWYRSLIWSLSCYWPVRWSVVIPFIVDLIVVHCYLLICCWFHSLYCGALIKIFVGFVHSCCSHLLSISHIVDPIDTFLLIFRYVVHLSFQSFILIWVHSSSFAFIHLFISCCILVCSFSRLLLFYSLYSLSSVVFCYCYILVISFSCYIRGICCCYHFIHDFHFTSCCCCITSRCYLVIVDLPECCCYSTFFRFLPVRHGVNGLRLLNEHSFSHLLSFVHLCISFLLLLTLLRQYIHCQPIQPIQP